MPRQTERRGLICGATIRVLSRCGMHRLTHRAVDAEARIPVGTTSRYFRSRAALLTAAAEAVRDRHRVYLESLAPDADPTDIGLTSALTAMITDIEQANRDLYLAWAELALESCRNPELRSILSDVRTMSINTARNLAGKAKIALTESQIDILGSLLVGVLHDRITLGRPQLPARTIAESLSRLVDPPVEKSGS